MITEETKLGVIRFADGGWLAIRNQGWGIFEVVDASAGSQFYTGWKYYLNPPANIEPAAWPHILLFGSRRSNELPKFWFIKRQVVGIDSTDASWH